MLTARTDDRLTSADRSETPIGILIAVGSVVTVAAACLAGQVPAGDPGLRLAVMATALAVFAAGSLDVVAVLAVVPLAWLVQDGFLLDRFGVLEWRGWSDLARLAVLVGAALVGLGLGWLRQREAVGRRG